jgi:pimeloyl-ACP methyl ester carboxylesterase
VPLAGDVRAFFARRAEMPAEEAVWASVPYNYGPATRAGGGGRIGEDVAQRLRFPITRDGYVAQLAAAMEHSALDRLGAVDAPTLVVHGDADVMVPPDNGALIAEAIPGAELLSLPGAGHLYPTDAPEADARVAEFLLDARSGVPIGG